MAGSQRAGKSENELDRKILEILQSRGMLSRTGAASQVGLNLKSGRSTMSSADAKELTEDFGGKSFLQLMEDALPSLRVGEFGPTLGSVIKSFFTGEVPQLSPEDEILHRGIIRERGREALRQAGHPNLFETAGF